MRRLRKFLGISWGDRLLLFITLVLLSGVRLGMWLLPFRTLLKLLTKISNSKTVNPSPVGKIVWAVNVVSNCCMPNVKCLARALSTQVLMSCYGYFPQLRIGVAKKEKGGLEAHAWVEYEGKVVIGNLIDLYRFIPLPSLEGVKL